jgi:integrase
MAFTMASLTRLKSGAYTARKGIPKDVREEYKRRHGQEWEARFSAPASTPLPQAKTRFNEWLAEIESRVGAIRAANEGEGRSLTEKQAQGLAGQWYGWFVARHEDSPGHPGVWEDLLDDLKQEVLAFAPDGFHSNEQEDEDWAWTKDEDVRSHMRPIVAEHALIDQFLASRRILLSREARDLLLDALDRAFAASVRSLIRRGQGDYSPDTYPTRFPQFIEDKRLAASASGLSPMALFKQWVATRKPAHATVNRWRGVLMNLDKYFDGASAEDVGESDVRRWRDHLITARRSEHTVAEVYMNAARTIFEWARTEDLIRVNPFSNVTVTVPRKIRRRDTNDFTQEEFEMILRGSLEVTKVSTPFQAAKRWVPWLCAYTGARAGEITQLRVCDVIKRDGVNGLRLTPDAGSTKSGTARTVPLHEHLVEQGFLKFVAEKGEGPLFYNPNGPATTADDPTNPRRPRAVKTRDRLASWVRSLGLKDTEIRPNHGWRHTFKQTADRHGISERVSDEITGHRPATVGQSYGRPTLGDMATALKKFPRYQT